ncbi:MinD/ParA family ATP-binding protein [Gordonia tangerina]|uniref:MinD/ParA family protein n=1 Tax=Gordonia tangerina TaxID=2911060 RepID=A0ABS9DNV3_9ACTN|nr:MinD/ParA family protein [Gordonia tangerina]MCF3940267.1 MinD/ParA family protein [Gordonia tangerina]
MTYDDSGSLDNSGVPAPPPWLQFAEPEPTEAPAPAPSPESAHRQPDVPPDRQHNGTAAAAGAPGHGAPLPPTTPPPPGTTPPNGAAQPPGAPPAQHTPSAGPMPATDPPGPRGPMPTAGPPPPSGPQPPSGLQPPHAPHSPNSAAAPQGPPNSFGAPPWPDAPAPVGPPPQPPAGPPPGQPPMNPGGPYGGYPMGPPGYADPQSGPALDEVALIRKARRPPSRGWRRAVHTISAGTINPGESSADVEYKRLLERVNRPVRGDYRIAVLSLKGGVGKTTTTVGLGSTFASLRGDRVIAVDANPDLGTLAQRVPQQTRSTVRDLLADTNVYRYSDVRAHTSQSPSRLEVLASERDPAMAEAFSEEEYRGVMRILQRFYNIIITDCGTGLSHSAMGGVLDLADAIILVSSPAMDGARSAGATLDWLAAHGYAHLVSRAVVVLSSSRPGASTIDTDQLGQHFLTRCRAVHKVPFDDHLSEGADVDLDLVSKQTRRAFAELAATIADDFSSVPTDRDEPFYQ